MFSSFPRLDLIAFPADLNPSRALTELRYSHVSGTAYPLRLLSSFRSAAGSLLSLIIIVRLTSSCFSCLVPRERTECLDPHSHPADIDVSRLTTSEPRLAHMSVSQCPK